MKYICSSFPQRLSFFFPLIFLWAHLPILCHWELNIKFQLRLYWCWSGVGEAVHVLQALFLSVHLSMMFVFFTTTWCCWLMFSLNTLFPPHPFVKSCYLTSSSSLCIYVNDCSFLCCTCAYWISSRFLQTFSPLYMLGILLVCLKSIPASCLVCHPSF